MSGINSIITAVTRHRVTADVIMLVFLLSGVWALTKITVSIFPPFETNTIVTTVVNAGETAADIEDSVVVPLENSLRNISGFKKMYSYSRESVGIVILEFPDSVDLESALEDVKSELEGIKLPSDAETPTVSVAEFEIQVASVTVVGAHPSELRTLVRRLENDLNSQGIGKITVRGLPKENINILVDQQKLIDLKLSVAQIGQAVAAQNKDASVGSVTGLGNERKIRTNSKSSKFKELYEIPIASTNSGGIIKLRDIAQIEKKVANNQVSLLYNGELAATLIVNISSDGNIIENGEKLNVWIAKQRTSLPQSVRLVSHDEEWRNVQSRLQLLVNNGLAGMILVVLMLCLFLSSNVAMWVGIGIPVAMFGTLFIFYQFGGTINMISMFALIMAVGIVVDDSIVVGENAQYRLSKGEPPMRAVISAGRTMFIPVFASSFTTIATFLPLFLITGPIGSIIFDIPFIIVCILCAALIECFLVLPGHLYRSFTRNKIAKPNVIRRTIDEAFDRFRENHFRKFSSFCVKHATATVVACFVMLFLSVNLLTNGFVNYRFFPNIDFNRLIGTVNFVSGTPRDTVDEYVVHMLDELEALDYELDPKVKIVRHVNALLGAGGERQPNRDNRANLRIELVNPEFRSVSVDEFSVLWRDRIQEVPGIVKIDIRAEGGGPPGRDIAIRLSAKDIFQLKIASQKVINVLNTIPGVLAVSDDTPFGKEEVIFELTALGRSLNIDIADVANQLRFALDGFEVQSFTEGVDETDLRVKIANFDSTNIFSSMYLLLPNGDYAPLRDIVTWQTAQGFETILHQFSQPAIEVSADLDPTAPTTVGAILSELEDAILLDLYATEGIGYSFEGKTADEEQTGKDMATGLILAFILIFIALTWVFNSWTLPFAIILTMPLGIVGTIAGHWIMGLSMSILSFFGMFTLMGILVNNSIVLVDCFKSLGVKNRDPQKYDDAIVEASCLRLRAVLLTTLTTICGLTPLLFETSAQAQFLIPMAVSICFGLAFGAVLILVFMPACLSIHGAIGRNWNSMGNKITGIGMKTKQLKIQN